MTKKTLKIDIIGTTGTGKSALAFAILELCSQYGIDGRITENPDVDDGIQNLGNWKRNMATLSEKVTVEINTHQANRKGWLS